MNLSIATDRLCGIVCLGIAACLHVTDQYVHVLGNEIIGAGHSAARESGSWPLLDAHMFSRSKGWMIVIIILAAFFLAKSFVADLPKESEKD